MATFKSRTKVLLVGDPTEIRSALDFLTQSGFSVDAAREHREALVRAESEEFDVIVVNGMCPGDDSLEVLSRLRPSVSIPIVILTPDDPICRISAFSLGADDCLPTPFHPGELLARLTAVVRRISPQKPEWLCVGDLRLCPGSLKAWYRSKRLRITSMESIILETLMRECGNVVSRDQISMQLYGRPASAFDRAVDTHVSRIRGKLGDAANLIVSVRGTGYQLCYPNDSTRDDPSDPLFDTGSPLYKS